MARTKTAKSSDVGMDDDSKSKEANQSSEDNSDSKDSRSSSSDGNTVDKSDRVSKKAQFGCQLAPRLPPGVVIRDVRGGGWVLGRAIGSGGFGDIYLCDRENQAEECPDNAPFVVKVEPHNNGPLFTEMHCLLRLGLVRQREDWTLPMHLPLCHASGSTVHEGTKLRFLVIDRLGSDLDKWFHGGESPWPLTTVLRVSIMVMESIRFVHSKGYAHNDVKAQNLLLGRGSDDSQIVYLVDFGLACKYRDSYGFHKSDEPDERKAHDGTLEYTSRDAHTGVHSRRGDLETLAYNMIHWASGNLPWMNELEDCEKVEASKIAYMENRVGFLSKCFVGAVYPPVLEEFIGYVCDLEFETEPDYDMVREMFEKCLLAMGKTVETDNLVFIKPKKVKKPVIEDQDDDKISKSLAEIAIDEGSQGASCGGETTGRRSRRLAEIVDEDEGTSSSFKWEDILSQNPDQNAKDARKKEPEEKIRQKEEFERRQKELLENPTPEMRRIMDNMEKLEAIKEEMSLKDQLSEFNKKRTAKLKLRFQEQAEQDPCYNTPAMQEVQDRRALRLSGGVESPITPERSLSPSAHADMLTGLTESLCLMALDCNLSSSERNITPRLPMTGKENNISLRRSSRLSK